MYCYVYTYQRAYLLQIIPMKDKKLRVIKSDEVQFHSFSVVA